MLRLIKSGNPVGSRAPPDGPSREFRGLGASRERSVRNAGGDKSAQVRDIKRAQRILTQLELEP